MLKKKIFQKLEVTSVSNGYLLSQFRKICKIFLVTKIIQIVKRQIRYLSGKKESEPEIPRYTQTTILLGKQKILIPDFASFKFMYKEIFEEEIYKFNTSRSKPYIIDGGANIGLATIYLKNLFPSSRIVAFEPDPLIFKILKNNISNYNFTDVELLQRGLWNKKTSLDFWSEGADGSLISELDGTRPSSTTVNAISLKPFLTERVDFLKLDIEGAETVVLKDIQEELSNVDRIFVEYHSFVNQPQSLSVIITILTEAGFRLQISSPGVSNRTPFIKVIPYNNMDMQLNIYGFKQNLS